MEPKETPRYSWMQASFLKKEGLGIRAGHFSFENFRKSVLDQYTLTARLFAYWKHLKHLEFLEAPGPVRFRSA